MSDDLERVERALAGVVRPGRKAIYMERRQGTVVALYADGTIDVTVGGRLIPRMRRKSAVVPVVGSTVFVEVSDTDLLVDDVQVVPGVTGLPRCRVFQTGNTTATSGAFIVPGFDVEDIDTHGFHAPGASQMVVPAGMAGWYDVRAEIAWSPNATGRRLAELQVGGVGWATVSQPPNTNGTNTILTVTDHVFAGDGAAIRVVTLQDSGATLTLPGTGSPPTFRGHPRLSIVRIGD